MPAFSFVSRWLRPKNSTGGSLLQQRIPTLLGLGLLVVGVIAGLTLVGSDSASQFLPRASEDAVPRQVRITNINDSGFTVSFVTDVASPGYVKYGSDQNRMNIQVRDDRDKLANTVANYLTHHITIQGLEPSTQYYFVLGTGDRTEFDNTGAPFAVRTARRQTVEGETRTAYGSVRNEVGNPADGAVVYVSIQGASPLSALVKPNGSWAVQLTNVRTQDLSALYTYSERDPVSVQVQGLQRDQSINISTSVGNISPLQDLVFGQENTIGAAATPEPMQITNDPSSDATQESGESSLSTQTGGFSTIVDESSAAPTTTSTIVEIELENNETIATQKPEFLGTAPANGFVQIEVHSEQAFFDVAPVDASGNWNWTPPEDLAPGDHSITVTYTDENGIQQKIERTFIVLAEGESSLPSFTSSPSGTIASPTPTPTPLPTPLPTPTPTPVPTPSPTSLVSVPATASAQPVSGNSQMTGFLIAVGLSFFGLGMFVTRRRTAEMME